LWISVINSSSSNTIGGTTPGAGNIISNNRVAGIDIGLPDSRSTGNLVQGNFIGTDITGTKALGNGPSTGICLGAGVCIGSSGNIIGGTTPEERNVISGNLGVGVAITNVNLRGVPVEGNYITDVTGTHALGNLDAGVVITDITGAAVANAILGNAIFSNGYGGIKLGGSTCGVPILNDSSDGSGVKVWRYCVR